jgi:hypothetical protein
MSQNESKLGIRAISHHRNDLILRIHIGGYHSKTHTFQIWIIRAFIFEVPLIRNIVFEIPLGAVSGNPNFHFPNI